MNIYFSCSITGGRQDQAEYSAIVNALHADGHDIPTEHLANINIVSIDNESTPADVYARDIAWLDACDAVVAEISTPSHGVGYEIAYALLNHKPVLCGFRSDRKASKMITGNPDPLLRVVQYHKLEEFIAAMRQYLSTITIQS